MNGPAAIVSKSFVNVTDPRLERGHNHDLLEMIFITLTATICGANSWADVERFANGKVNSLVRCEVKVSPSTEKYFADRLIVPPARVRCTR